MASMCSPVRFGSNSQPSLAFSLVVALSRQAKAAWHQLTVCILPEPAIAVVNGGGDQGHESVMSLILLGVKGKIQESTTCHPYDAQILCIKEA